MDHSNERDVFALQPFTEHERLPPKAEKGQCERCRQGEREEARVEFGGRLRSYRFAQATLQCRRWRCQRQRRCQRNCDGLSLRDPLRARRALRDVKFDVAGCIVVEDPKGIEFRVFAQMLSQERLPPGLASSVCNLRIAIEMRLLIVPSGASSSFAISTCVLFP